MSLVFIASATASSSATVAFTSGIDSTYNEYQFQFVNMHPATNNVNFTFQVNAAGASGFNETITSTSFQAYHYEPPAFFLPALAYHTSSDQAQGTAYQTIVIGGGNGADEASSGILTLYAPSSTTYVKHFVSTGGTCFRGSSYGYDTAATITTYVGGYINTTSAIDEISFKMSSGNTDAGTIYMYGVG